MEISQQKIMTFFMFSGKAEEAMNFYVSIFDNAQIQNIMHYGANQAGKEGSVLYATFSLKGQTFMCFDNNNGNDFPFTPALSLFVTCDTDEEIERVFAELSKEGKVLMPLASSPVSEKLGWIKDKFGVSWQLNLANR